jgi:hypothetical protein
MPIDESQLRVGSARISTVFDLLGHDEDSTSLAIAWGLHQCPELLRRFLEASLSWKGPVNEAQIVIHRHEVAGGITDIEIIQEGRFHLIVEAKRGWRLPGRRQLERYASRQSFRQSRARVKGLLSLSECSPEYAGAHLPGRAIRGFPLRHLSWRQLVDVAESSRKASGLHQRRVLDQLIGYLRSLMTSQDQESNLVYVVALSADTEKGWSVSWIDVVRKHRRYFHPIGSRWPSDPPNYLGFRYSGQLQSVHHVERYEVIEDLSRACAGIPKMPVPPHFLYHLGQPILPPHEVRTGNLYRNQRVRCAIDLLLTSKTIAQARDRTRNRLSL